MDMLYLLVIQCFICFNFIGATDKRIINGYPVLDFGTLILQYNKIDYLNELENKLSKMYMKPRTTKILLDSIVRAKITIMLKIKKISKSFLSHIGNIKRKLRKQKM